MDYGDLTDSINAFFFAYDAQRLQCSPPKQFPCSYIGPFGAPQFGGGVGRSLMTHQQPSS
jgi:hypothetical protein